MTDSNMHSYWDENNFICNSSEGKLNIPKIGENHRTPLELTSLLCELSGNHDYKLKSIEELGNLQKRISKDPESMMEYATYAMFLTGVLAYKEQHLTDLEIANKLLQYFCYTIDK